MENKDYQTFDIFEYLNVSQKQRIIVKYNNNYIPFGFEKIFDALPYHKSTKELLDNIYSYSLKQDNNNYIDNRTFISYLATSKLSLPPMAEKFLTIGNIKDSNMNIKIGRGGRNINSSISNIDFENSKPYITEKREKILDLAIEEILQKAIDEALQNFMPLIKEDFCIVSNKTIYYKNFNEFMLGFLNCIFSTSNQLYIKKCKLCNKYYITYKSDTLYCHRVRNFNNEDITCDMVIAKIQKTYEYKQIMKTNKSFLQKIENNKNISQDYIDKYINGREEAKLKSFQKNDLSILKEYIDKCKEDYINTY